jgi:hypothetical protein
VWWSEADWLRSANPHHLLAILERQKVKSKRRFRLVAVACCRRVWDDCTESERKVVEVAERYADRHAKYHELLDVSRTLRQAEPTPRRGAAEAALNTTHREARVAVMDVLYTLLRCAWGGPDLPTQEPTFWAEGSRWFSRLIRDIFNNPFRPSQPLPPAILAWNDRTIPRLAEAIYEDRKMPEGTLDPARLGILADALLDAGCDDEGLLAHLRGPGPHVRGCWAVDLLLGRQ